MCHSVAFHRLTNALHTKVETKRGVATMDGKAGLAAEKDLVTKLVNDVKRVKSVKNRMTIEQLSSDTHGLPDR